MKSFMRVIKYILLISIIISIIFFLIATDFNEVQLQLSTIGTGFILVFIPSICAQYFGALAWKFSFKNSHGVSIWKLLHARIIGENISLFNPTNIVAGEAIKFNLLNNTPTSTEDRLQSILISRVFLIATQLTLSAICLVWLMDAVSISVAIAFFAGLFICGYSLYYRMQRLVLSSKLDFLKIGRFTLRATLNHVVKTSKGIGVFCKENPRKLFFVNVFSLGHWFMGGLELCIILSLLGISPEYLGALSIDMGVVLIKSLAGFIPGQVGIEELGNKWMLTVIGIHGASIWISVSILRRTKQLIWIIISGLLYFIPRVIIKNKKIKYGTIIHNT